MKISIWKNIFIDYSEMNTINLTKKKVIFIGLIYMWIHFSILIFFVSTNSLHKIILCIAWIINMFTIYLLCRKNGIKIAVNLMSAAWLLNVTNTAWNTGGIYSPSMIWQVLLIFILATYLDRKASFWATIYVIFNYVFFFYIHYSGIKNFKESIVYNPAFFELTSISSLYIIILLCLFFIFTEENFNQIWKKEKEIKIDILEVELDKKMNEIGVLRNKIARDFHDEMGNKLASIRLLSENLSLKSENNILENDDLLKTLNIIEKSSKELFEGTKDFIWSVGTKSDSVQDFFDYIREFAEKFLNELDLNLNTKIEISKDFSKKIDPSSTRQLIFVIKEIITNTAKHSKATNVEMNFTIDDKNLIIKVLDDGIGFDVLKPKLRGLKNIEYRLNRINAKFVCSSSELGTHYEINLPL